MTLTGAEGERADRLREERDFFLASIEDLEREHAAGDVDDGDFAALRQGYVARAADTLRELAALEELAGATEQPAAAAPPGRPAAGPVPAGPVPAAGRRPSAWQDVRRRLGRRRTRRLLGAAGAVCVLGILTIAAARLAGVRLPGEVATGSIALPTATAVRQDLEQASQMASAGRLTAALALYDEVLATVPGQQEALAYRAWLLRLSGIAAHSAPLVREADAELAAVAKSAPGYADARALDGVALLEDRGEVAAAVAEFRAALGDGVSDALLRSLGRTMATAFADEGVPLPARLAPYRSAG